MQQVPNYYHWQGDAGRVHGRWNTAAQTNTQAPNPRIAHPPYPATPSSVPHMRSGQIGNMSHGDVLIESPYLLQNEFSDNSYGWDEGSYYGDGIIPMLTRLPDEMDTWESSGSSSYYQLSSTASNKSLAFSLQTNDSLNSEWKEKPVRQWDTNDIMYWLISVAQDHGLNSDKVELPRFNDLDGGRLCTMTESQFVSRDPKHGKILYGALQQLLNQKDREQLFSSVLNPLPTLHPVEDSDDDRVLTELDVRRQGSSMEANHSSEESDAPSETVPLQKKKVGRPRLNGIGRRSRKLEKKTGRLWEFIRDLLLNRDYCPSLICWENHDEGVFRFVRSEKVAQLWGTIKENPKMTYEKLSRAMRYYYKSKVLQPVLGRRLVYKFGPTATGWRTPNPNFRLP